MSNSLRISSEEHPLQFSSGYSLRELRWLLVGQGPEGVRNLLKYQYWRTVEPERDWVIEPDFDFHTSEPSLLFCTKLSSRLLLSSFEILFVLVRRSADYDAIGGVQYHGRSYQGTPNGGSVSLSRFAAEQVRRLPPKPFPLSSFSGEVG